MQVTMNVVGGKIDRRNRRARALRFESLDPRITLDGTSLATATSATTALPWFDPSSLTYSFAPDGTLVGNEQSSLFAKLAPIGSPQEWQAEMVKAFDQWLGILGTSIQGQTDSGSPFGTFGPTQGDLRFGDIRIAAIPLAGDMIAEAIPHSMISQGTWAGDILLNSNANWSNLQQVYSVALHEFGHVLGLEHSEDPQSPMFFHGVYDALVPTADDAAKLKTLYAGIDLHADEEDSPEHRSLEHHSREGEREDGGPNEVQAVAWDVGPAIPLTAVLSALPRYSASGALGGQADSMTYKLQPIGEIDHAQYLNVVVSATEQFGLIPNVSVYDNSGDRIPATILHNSEGVLVVQARDVDPKRAYYVTVTPAATAPQYQSGGFELFAEYGLSKLGANKIGSYFLTAERPIAEQSFTVSSSRLVHLLVSSESKMSPNADAAVWGTLVDSQNNVVAQLAMNPGDTRSAPLVFLNPGEYKLILQSGTRDGSRPVATKLKVYVDEISIDVGPGIIDPTKVPITCKGAGGITTPCSKIATVIVVEGPVYPDPTKLPPISIYPSLPPWNNPALFYWPIMVTPHPPSLILNANSSLVAFADALGTAGDALLSNVDLNSSSLLGSSSNPSADGSELLLSTDEPLAIDALELESNSVVAFDSHEGHRGKYAMGRGLRSLLVDHAIAEGWVKD